jgi:hypothetical protein
MDLANDDVGNFFKYFPTGPVAVGASFIMVGVTKKKLYVLNAVSVSGNVVYYMESDPQTLVDSTMLPIFSYSGSVIVDDKIPIFNLTYSDATNGGGPILDKDGVTIVNSSITNPLIAFGDFEPWFPPNILLSGAAYAFNAKQGTGAAKFLTSPTGATPPIDAVFSVLPVVSWFNCGGGVGDTINTPSNSLLNFLCILDPTFTQCQNISVVDNAWTNVNDCIDGIDYFYCPLFGKCGKDNCKGPCSAIYYDCDNNDGTYTCTFNPNEYIYDSQWWTSPIFIGLVVFIAALILIFIIIIIVEYRHNNSVNNQP